MLVLVNTSSLLGVMDPDDYHGPRTKWKTMSGYPSTRGTIPPDLLGLSVADWVAELQEAGANMATINVEARNNLLTNPIHDTYSLTEENIANEEYTPGQRDILLVDFLLAVQAAIDANLIDGDFSFNAHQRLYPNHNAAKEQDFIEDFSGFINAAKTAGVDHLISGIRLGENGIDAENGDSNYLLELALFWAMGINSNTGDWLKNNACLAISGGDRGMFFNGIDNKSNSPTFFQEISQETASFAFCWKQFILNGVGNKMTSLGYNENSTADWLSFMHNDCGFKDLEKFIDTHKADYPLHANVIFIGDSADGMKKIKRGGGAYGAEYTAITEMFTSASIGFKGILGVNGYKAASHKDNFDCLHKVKVNTGAVIDLPLSQARWSAWPYNDGFEVHVTQTDDSWNSENATNQNKADNVYLKVRSNATGKEKRSYLKFDIHGLTGPVVSATLNIFSNDVDYPVDCYSSSNDWEEWTTNWNDQAAVGGLLDTQVCSPSSWAAFDVTSAVTDNGLVSFALKTSVDVNKNFSSKEGANPPFLTVTYQVE
jgi:hypothetical protein